MPATTSFQWEKKISRPIAQRIIPPAIVALLEKMVPNFLPIKTAATLIPKVTMPIIKKVV